MLPLPTVLFGHCYHSFLVIQKETGLHQSSFLKICYPLYQFGNPQLRVFRTDYFLTLVRPGVPLSEDTVQFRIPMEMTKVEVKDYLENIYNVPVASVRTRIQYGSMRMRDYKNCRIKKPDYKVAYVQLEVSKLRLLWQRGTLELPRSLPDPSQQICKETVSRNCLFHIILPGCRRNLSVSGLVSRDQKDH
ncbi:large ribosomal subunit protein uL23m isoform X3 [Pogona vitticeps]